MTRKKQKPGNKMSRQPPLPPDLPPRPSAPAVPYGSDSYRPQGDSYHPTNPPPPMYQFRGAASSASQYRPSYDSYYQRAPPPRYDDYPPGTRPNQNSYRPPQDNFDFRYDAPPSINMGQADTYRPRSPPRPREYPQDNNRNHRQNNHAENNRGAARGGYRGRAGPRMASNREFLKTKRGPTPELMPGMDEDAGNGVRYKPVDDVSDSEEAEMDLSNTDDEGDAQQTKRTRTETKAADGDSVPRWSNPDPYTALPPPDESQRRKKDVVKLIRKARVNTSSDSATKTEAATDDFISFDFGDDDQNDAFKQDEPPAPGVEGAPTGPRFSHRDNAHKQEPKSSQSIHFQPINAPQSELNEREGPLNQQQGNVYNSHSGSANAQEPNRYNGAQQASNGQPLQAVQNQTPGKQNKPIDLTPNPALGNRKRTFNDEIKGPPQIHGPFNNKGSKPSNGEIIKSWKSAGNIPPTPWLSLDHSETANMGVWLHKEIMDWYHYVKPRHFEQFIREKLIEDLRIRIKQNFKRDCDIHSFGSFPAGLYLPTADMDLVCVSDEYMRTGFPVLGGSYKKLRAFEMFLYKEKLALNDEIEVISKAKVPLVKYVDRLTGLKVDISFENSTGLVANKTFQDWKAQFPAMPILATLIKHFMAMRGLNEPVNGGMGGFSVICLVVSLLQQMPQVQSRSMIPEHHLGEVLMEFLDLYGNQFDVSTTAISTNPAQYISKQDANIPYKGGAEKFMIIDPNRPSNDISGGSTNSTTIRRAFSSAFSELSKRMGQVATSPQESRSKQSLLHCILGGNYTSFELQREHLAHVHEKLFGPVKQ